MSNDFTITLEPFKQMVADCYKAIQARDEPEAIDAAWKCVGLHYLHLEGSEVEKMIAVTYLKWLAGKYIEWECSL